MNQAPTTRPYAPIALFAYRRIDLLGAVLDSLEACPEFSCSDVFVFSDGARNEGARSDVEAVRTFVRRRLRPNMRLIEANGNKGLSRSIIEGVSKLCGEYGRAIVIEDDLIVSPVILTWFNAALDRYANEPKVMQVSGHMFDCPGLRGREEGFCLPMVTSWGWATWKRAWDTFDAEAIGWEILQTDRKIRRRFDLDGVYPYTKMLRQQMAGKINSWAIRWNWTLFRHQKLVLYPPQSLVANRGLDGNATHRGIGGAIRGIFGRESQLVRLRLPEFPVSIEVDPDLYEMTRRSIWAHTSKLSPLHWLRR